MEVWRRRKEGTELAEHASGPRRRVVQHAGYRFGAHSYRAARRVADHRILVALLKVATRTACPPAGRPLGRGRYSSFVRNSQGGMPIASARLRGSATPAGSVR